MAQTKAAGPPPTERTLHDAALAHLARYGTTRQGLVRVLDRRVERWARAMEDVDPEIVRAAKAAVRVVADRLVAAGAVNDAAFAESRARSLARIGRSRRAIAAHLAARGVDGEVAQAVLPQDPAEDLAAAIAYARRRRIGPFRRGEADAMRELAMLARAGFSRDIAEQALEMDPDAAEALLIRLKQA
jgi:regulatory protein